MRLPRGIVLIFCGLACAAGAPAVAAPEASHSRDLGLQIRVEGGGWGGASRENIETVLYAAADELLSRLPAKLAAPIVVTHTQSNPIALYDRGPHGEYMVRLHASDTRWHLYVYEFAHELCHLMSNYEEPTAAYTGKHNQWFEETLCETASLYTLKSLAARWEASPPGAEWSGQAARLRGFDELLLAEKHRRFPPGESFAAWLGENERQLQRDPYQRQQNEKVASLLLPLFEHSPHWDALCYLNLDPADAQADLRQYLHHWQENAPPEHKAFVAAVLGLLGAEPAAPLARVATPSASPR